MAGFGATKGEFLPDERNLSLRRNNIHRNGFLQTHCATLEDEADRYTQGKEKKDDPRFVR